jgi:hypothetical protein
MAAIKLLKLAQTATAAQELIDYTGVPERMQGRLENISLAYDRDQACDKRDSESKWDNQW